MQRLTVSQNALFYGSVFPREPAGKKQATEQKKQRSTSVPATRRDYDGEMIQAFLNIWKAVPDLNYSRNEEISCDKLSRSAPSHFPVPTNHGKSPERAGTPLREKEEETEEEDSDSSSDEDFDPDVPEYDPSKGSPKRRSRVIGKHRASSNQETNEDSLQEEEEEEEEEDSGSFEDDPSSSQDENTLASELLTDLSAVSYENEDLEAYEDFRKRGRIYELIQEYGGFAPDNKHGYYLRPTASPVNRSCTFCRVRRTSCDVKDGNSPCTNCKQHGSLCMTPIPHIDRKARRGFNFSDDTLVLRKDGCHPRTGERIPIRFVDQRGLSKTDICTEEEEKAYHDFLHPKREKPKHSRKPRSKSAERKRKPLAIRQTQSEPETSKEEDVPLVDLEMMEIPESIFNAPERSEEEDEQEQEDHAEKEEEEEEQQEENEECAEEEPVINVPPPRAGPDLPLPFQSRVSLPLFPEDDPNATEWLLGDPMRAEEFREWRIGMSPTNKELELPLDMEFDPNLGLDFSF